MDHGKTQPVSAVPASPKRRFMKAKTIETHVSLVDLTGRTGHLKDTTMINKQEFKDQKSRDVWDRLYCGYGSNDYRNWRITTRPEGEEERRYFPIRRTPKNLPTATAQKRVWKPGGNVLSRNQDANADQTTNQMRHSPKSMRKNAENMSIRTQSMRGEKTKAAVRDTNKGTPKSQASSGSQATRSGDLKKNAKGKRSKTSMVEGRAGALDSSISVMKSLRTLFQAYVSLFLQLCPEPSQKESLSKMMAELLVESSESNAHASGPDMSDISRERPKDNPIEKSMECQATPQFLDSLNKSPEIFSSQSIPGMFDDTELGNESFALDTNFKPSPANTESIIPTSKQEPVGSNFPRGASDHDFDGHKSRDARTYETNQQNRRFPVSMARPEMLRRIAPTPVDETDGRSQERSMRDDMLAGRPKSFWNLKSWRSLGKENARRLST